MAAVKPTNGNGKVVAIRGDAGKTAPSASTGGTEAPDFNEFFARVAEYKKITGEEKGGPSPLRRHLDSLRCLDPQGRGWIEELCQEDPHLQSLRRYHQKD